MIDDTPAFPSYSAPAALLHWLIAVFILFNLAVGYFMEDFSPPLKGLVLPLHISSGMTVLALTLVRIAWRLGHVPPPQPPATKPWERHLAHGVHALLYGAMLAMPITGWAILSAHPAPGTPGFLTERQHMPATPPGPPRAHAGGGIQVWGLIPAPAIAPIQAIGATAQGLPVQKAMHERFVAAHWWGGALMIALLALHLGGVIKHTLEGTPMLPRMRLGRCG